jgi:polyphosphate kinase
MRKERTPITDRPAAISKQNLSINDSPTAPDLHSPELYLNRELSWLEFNRRVMHEAEDERNPLLERVKFLAVTSNNLDQFFMKRLGGLKKLFAAGMRSLSVDGRTPVQQIEQCHLVIRAMERRKHDLLNDVLLLLQEKGIAIARHDDLDEREKLLLRDRFLADIFPLITPQAIDPAHPFPFISNLSLNLLVTLRYPGKDEELLARVKAPAGVDLPRFLRVGDMDRFVTLEDLLLHNLDLIFPEMEVVACELFRVTRNANTDRSYEQEDDLMALIESELRDRRFAPIVRLEVATGMGSVRRGMLAAELELDEADDVFEVEGMLAMGDLLEISELNYPELRFRSHHPADHPMLASRRNMFHIIRDAGSILLHHPYQSFTTSVERFLHEASVDPKVRAIKMTLYRTARDSRIIDCLVNAANNGKQVAVVVELKARFDEAANMSLAEQMEEAGIHVTYGVVGLKTHCKLILVVRQDYSGLRRYVHIGTGNYHPGTARLYTDMGIITCDDSLGRDATELFNYLTTGLNPYREYIKLLPAPNLLKNALLDKINREISLHTPASPGLIRFKMNSLEDTDISEALYRASIAGVRVELIVRDSCRVRPGLPGISENMRIISIVGRFLEHIRIYFFKNGGEEEYFIASTDAVKRNLECRIEVLAPVESPEFRKEIRTMLDAQFNDRRSAWELQSDGSYILLQPGEGDDPRSSQELFIATVEERQREAAQFKKSSMPDFHTEIE